MLEIKCDLCKELLTKPGALLFSPPNQRGYVKKFHLCQGCYSGFILPLEPLKAPRNYKSKAFKTLKARLDINRQRA
jgi:hypothetical protein